MNGITERLANLSTVTVILIVVVLLVLRYVLLKFKTPGTRSAAEIAESLAIALGLVFLIIRPFFVQAFFIPSPSMVPALLVHDHILVNKTVYRIREPLHGEIVVFKAPREAMILGGQMADGETEAKQTDYIKRVIGVPGDVIYIRQGYVLVNGVRWNHNDLRNTLADPDEPVRIKSDGIFVAGKKVTVQDLAERLGTNAKVELHPGYVVRNGHRLSEPYLYEDPDQPYPVDQPDPTDPQGMQVFEYFKDDLAEGNLQLIRDRGPLRVKLGKGQYLMMGDNRNNSSDGRRWGTLERKRVVGRAMFIFWPFSRIHWVK